ncbi:transposase [bacterium]|nr:transposase [bacterium]
MRKRFEGNNHARFLTFGCYNHQKLFYYDQLCILFVNHLDKWRRREKLLLFAFVLMPNHVHLLVYHPEKNAGQALGRLKSRFSKHALRWLEQFHPQIYKNLEVKDHGKIIHRFWQAGGGYDLNLFNEELFIQKMTYIRKNPVKAGLVVYPEQYSWSSARFWRTSEAIPLAMDIPGQWSEIKTETRGLIDEE